MAETTKTTRTVKKVTIGDLYKEFSKVDLTSKVKSKNGVSYLPWARVWNEVMLRHPDSTWTPEANQEGFLYFHDGRTAYVKVSVTIEGITREMRLPVMNFKNQSVPLVSMNYCDVNKAIMRCLVKNLAVNFGLGINVYCDEAFIAGGEDDYFSPLADLPTGAPEMAYPVVDTTTGSVPATAPIVTIDPKKMSIEDAVDIIKTPFPFKWKDCKGTPCYNVLLKCIAFDGDSEEVQRNKKKNIDDLNSSIKYMIDNKYSVKIDCSKPIDLKTLGNCLNELIKNPQKFVDAYEKL